MHMQPAGALLSDTTSEDASLLWFGTCLSRTRVFTETPRSGPSRACCWPTVIPTRPASGPGRRGSR